MHNNIEYCCVITNKKQTKIWLPTNTGRRGWQARLTIGFLRSVFILVGGLPPSTVPTTRRNQKVKTWRWTFKNKTKWRAIISLLSNKKTCKAKRITCYTHSFVKTEEDNRLKGCQCKMNFRIYWDMIWFFFRRVQHKCLLRGKITGSDCSILQSKRYRRGSMVAQVIN